MRVTADSSWYYSLVSVYKSSSTSVCESVALRQQAEKKETGGHYSVNMCQQRSLVLDSSELDNRLTESRLGLDPVLDSSCCNMRSYTILSWGGGVCLNFSTYV